jgi:hypothetical protein
VVKLDDIPDGVELNETHLIFWALVAPVSETDMEHWEGDRSRGMHYWVIGSIEKAYLHTLRISRQNKIARREGDRVWKRDYEYYLQWESATKRLVILE